ncbi:ABC transporter substrate-binding protein, partial [Acinetobacter baumannii]
MQGLKAGIIAAALAVVTAAPALGADQQVKIGVITDMSSLFSDFGGAGSVLAARMAVEDFGGQALGKPIEVVSADHQN